MFELRACADLSQAGEISLWSSGPPAREGRQNVKSRRHAATLAAGLLVSGSVLLAACGSSSSSQTTTTSSSSPASTTTTTIPYVASKNARADVTTTGACAKSGSEWELKGNVKNSAKFARSYQIVVDFVTVPGNTVLDTKIVNVATLSPGASSDWSALGAPGDNHVACVIRQVQFTK
jgi:ABC-type glycerol-3-phosphate transport system substrate-binding protein